MTDWTSECPLLWWNVRGREREVLLFVPFSSLCLVAHWGCLCNGKNSRPPCYLMRWQLLHGHKRPCGLVERTPCLFSQYAQMGAALAKGSIDILSCFWVLSVPVILAGPPHKKWFLPIFCLVWIREWVVYRLGWGEHAICMEREGKKRCECTPWMETAYLIKGLPLLFMIPDSKTSLSFMGYYEKTQGETWYLLLQTLFFPYSACLRHWKRGHSTYFYQLPIK